MSALMLRVPAALGGDSSDVAVALEVAGALWEKGDNEEAIRWLKRAADAADQAGDSSRAVNLTQVAGDFEAELKARRDDATQSVPSAPGESTDPSTSTPPPAPAMSPPPPDEAGDIPAEGLVSASPSYAPPKRKSASFPPPASPAQASSPTPALGRDGGMRVSVKSSVRDPNLLLLRPLPEGQSPPVGTREGFLVLTEDTPEPAPRRSQRPPEGDGRNSNGSGVP